jgi:copper transport protein
MQVATVTALLSTQYGAVLLTKVGLIGVVALFGLRHALLTWRGLMRRSAPLTRFPSRLPLTIGLEATGALAVVALAAVLGASAPAIGPQFAPPDLTPNITQLTKDQDDLLITLAVKPNRSGPNLVSVRLVNTTRPARAPVQSVTILVRPPDDAQGQLMATTRSGLAFDAGSVRLGAGDVSFTVRITRAGLGDTVVNIPWRVEALDVVRVPVVVSNQSLAPVVNLLALLLLTLAALGAVAAVALVRRQSRPVAQPAQAARQGVAGPLPRHRYSSGAVPPSHRRAGLGLVIRRRGWLRRRARRR